MLLCYVVIVFQETYAVKKNFKEDKMSGEIVPAGKQSFIRVKDHDLAATGKKLSKLSDKAIEVMAQGLESEDEKVRLECAKSLIKMNIDISKIINEDAMNRLISEFRFIGVNNESPKDVSPLVDFSNIQQV
jgi:hypothetical protein